MKYIVIGRTQFLPDDGINQAYLQVDQWNDYSFVTMFSLFVFDDHGKRHKIGTVKIGFQGQTTEKPTYSEIDDIFEELPAYFFSLGTDLDYYKNIRGRLDQDTGDNLLKSLRDVAHDDQILEIASKETVFKTSHLRSSSVNTIKGQFRRVLDGEAVLTDFSFNYIRPADDKMSKVELEFNVVAESKPSVIPPKIRSGYK